MVRCRFEKGLAKFGHYGHQNNDDDDDDEKKKTCLMKVLIKICLNF